MDFNGIFQSFFSPFPARLGIWAFSGSVHIAIFKDEASFCSSQMVEFVPTEYTLDPAVSAYLKPVCVLLHTAGFLNSLQCICYV